MLKYFEITKDSERAKKFFTDKLAYTITPGELRKVLDEIPDDIQVVDVRKFEDFSKGHIPAAINIPYDQLEVYIGELPKNKVIIVYSYNIVCHLGAKGALFLAENNIPVMELCGGFEEWQNKDFEVISTPN